MLVIRNTYPKHPGVPHAEFYDIVHWVRTRTGFDLVRFCDEAVVYKSPDCDRDGKLRSNGQPPKLCGVVAEVRSRGWVLELSNARLQGCERSEHTLQGVVRHSDSGGAE